MSSVFRSDKRTARKAHRCGECGITIQPGTVYTAEGGINDGRAWDQKLCLPCAGLVAWGWSYPSVFDSDGRELGGMLTDLVQHDIVYDNAGALDIDPAYADELEIDPIRNYPQLKTPAP